MSFSKEVKKEITTLNLDEFSLKGEFYGFLRLKKELIISNNNIKIEMGSRDLFIIRRICSIIKKLYHINVEIRSKEEKNLKKEKYYSISILDNTKDILIDLNLIDEHFNFIDKIPNIYNPEDVIRGMFLAKGSVNNPQCSRYHFEIKCNEEEEYKYLIHHLKKYDINAKMVVRKGLYVVYVKKSEQIGDCLKLFGITSTFFAFENERIRKDLNCVVNRITNCDLANTEKARAAAQKQLKEIEFIQKIGKFESLSIRLMEVAILRINNPFATLLELSEASEETIGKYLSKSGISHCLKDLELHAKYLGYKE